MAKELGVPVIVTAQLNRQADVRGREGQPPRLKRPQRLRIY
jgi:replicative DNA helicase